MIKAGLKGVKKAVHMKFYRKKRPQLQVNGLIFIKSLSVAKQSS